MASYPAQYEDGAFRLSSPLPLRRGERVQLIVSRCPDPTRWNFDRLANARENSQHEDETLSKTGLDSWVQELDGEDRK